MSNDMFTLDLCKHCVLRGDYEKCKVEPCTVHESWYAKESREQMKKGLIETINSECTRIGEETGIAPSFNVAVAA